MAFAAAHFPFVTEPDVDASTWRDFGRLKFLDIAPACFALLCMLFMVIESFRGGNAQAVGERLRQKGRMLPSVSGELGGIERAAVFPNHGGTPPRSAGRLNQPVE
jgi:hypothetical protein